MGKILWPLIIGGAVTFIIYKTHRAFAWVALALTLAWAFFSWKGGR